MAFTAVLLTLLLTAQQQTDPLIAQTAQRWAYLGSITLLIAIVLAIGIFFRRLERAIAFAILLTAVLIYLMLTL
jgi:hypothetical protein